MKKVMLSDAEIEVLKFVVETFAKSSLEVAEEILEETKDEENADMLAALADATAMRALHEKLCSAEEESRILLA